MTPANTVAVLALLLLTQSLCVSTGLFCPNLSYLDSSVQLICTGGSISHKYINPRGVDVAQCPLIKDRPCTPANAPASVISSTQTVFNVTAVTTTDAGTWSCDVGVNEFETCNLTVAKTPACSITGKEDTDVLAQYQELTLKVDIKDYYCSTALTFSLQTGNVTTLLIEADSVASVTDNTSSVTLNVTDSHLGIVRLLFRCDNSQWNLTCNGVTELETKTAAVPENDGIATASTPIIAACVVGAIVFLIIVVVIIVFLVKRKQVTQIKAKASLQPSSLPYITVGTPGSSAYATVELNDAPSGSKNITVIDAGGYACIENYVNNDENRSSSLTKEESNELSVAATSTGNPKNDLRVVVQHMIPKDNASHINELHIAIDKTKDMTVHNDETAI